MYCAELLSEVTARKIIEDFPDVNFDFITFVPMTDKAKRLRGYNQSEIIARQIAGRLFIPCHEILIKTKDTPKQHHLTSESRRKNLADAITLRSDISVKDKTILICDDIKTTGSTLLVCEKLLMSSGASEVYCAVTAIPVFANIPAAIDKEGKKP